MKKHLIIFTRFPEAGRTKTRLIPMLGPQGAADLQRKMTEHTLAQVARISASNPLRVEVRYDGGDEALLKNWLGHDYVYRPQGDKDLGTRMKQSFEDAFRSGAEAAVIIGTDIPDLAGTDILKAFDILERKNLVLGPAKDGGYYLIGLQKTSFPHGENVFAGITWGTHDVLERTAKAAKRLGLSVSFLRELKDVDRPEDLSIWERSQNKAEPNNMPGHISVIIPVINEAANIAETLHSLGHGNTGEVIVVDGGSHDNTVSIAKSMGANVIKGTPPRARQMNQGAAVATGEIFLFLHSDTRLPPKFDQFILHCLKPPGIAAGAFELNIDSPGPALRIIERVANWRSRHLKMPYGDQAIFMFSHVFYQVGGFPSLPIMEDFELVRQLRKRGKIEILSVPVQTSGRRWQNYGILKTTLTNQMIIMAYYLGIPPHTIARLYHRNRGILKYRRPDTKISE
jgi:uncharacterized protein